MTTTFDTTTPDLPAWFDLDAVHTAEARAELGHLVDDAQRVLEAVADFNRRWLVVLRRYYEQNAGLGEDLSELVDQVTGMEPAQEYLALAHYILEHTNVFGGSVTSDYATVVAAKHALHLEGVGRFDRGTGEPCPLPYVGDDD